MTGWSNHHARTALGTPPEASRRHTSADSYGALAGTPGRILEGHTPGQPPGPHPGHRGHSRDNRRTHHRVHQRGSRGTLKPGHQRGHRARTTTPLGQAGTPAGPWPGYRRDRKGRPEEQDTHPAQAPPPDDARSFARTAEHEHRARFPGWGDITRTHSLSLRSPA